MKLSSFLLLAFWLSFFTLAATANAQTAVMGVAAQDQKEELNILSSTSASAYLLRGALCSGLVGKNSLGQVSLRLARSVRFLDSALEFELSEQQRFPNGVLLASDDLIWSLERCKNKEIVSPIDSAEIKYSAGRQFLYLKAKAGYTAQELFTALSKCPILQRESSFLFAKDLGIGTNLVCAGAYQITDYRAANFYQLRRVLDRLDDPRSPRIELRFVLDHEQGLSLVRSGQMSLFFSEHEAVLERARQDATLKLGSCWGHSWLARRDFSFDCSWFEL